MKIDILTLFPQMFTGPFDESIVKRAQDKKLVEINIHNLRKWTKDKYQTVDDRPYGGGAGMVMMVEPIFKAIKTLKKAKSPLRSEASKKPASQRGEQKAKIILLSPRGNLFNQKKAQELSKMDHLILICGHYEGVDERVSQHFIDEEISIGDYVVTGGELPTMVLVDSIVRLIPGVLEKEEATKNESFQQLAINNQQLTILESPQYTRPKEFNGWSVPEILLSGDHKKIQEWRQEQSLVVTKKKRPDLIKNK